MHHVARVDLEIGTVRARTVCSHHEPSVGPHIDRHPDHLIVRSTHAHPLTERDEPSSVLGIVTLAPFVEQSVEHHEQLVEDRRRVHVRTESGGAGRGPPDVETEAHHHVLHASVPAAGLRQDAGELHTPEKQVVGPFQVHVLAGDPFD